MNRYVLYVDDEPAKVSEYREEISGLGLSLKYCQGVEEALEWLKKHENQVAVVVADIMMPPGDVYDVNQTVDGLLTGVFFYRDVRTLCGGGVPVYLLTNSSDPAIRNAVEGDSNAEVVMKTEVLFDEFCDIVRLKLGLS
jgi:CheY-like chemotaxis protein